MSRYLRERFEDVDLSPGQGRISATLAVALGSLALLTSFCFLFPQWFTTPEFRGFYNAGLLRGILFAGIGIAFLAGLVSVWRHPDARYGLAGMVLACMAALLGSGRLNVPAVEGRSLYAGLDYFVLTLLVLALVFIPLERLYPKDRDQRVLRRGWITDMKYFLFSHVGVQLISFFTVIPIQVFLHDHVHVGFQQWVAAQPLWLQFIEILVVVDLASYWIHRAFHEVPWLWKFHAVHHSSEQLDWMASSRLHLVEIIANRFAGYLPIFLFGFAPSAVYAYLVFISSHAIFIHANVRFRFPVVRWLIATPEFHHWHHSSEDEAVDKNYAAFLPVYDKLFGTLFMPDRLAARYGTRVSTRVPEGVVRQFSFPFRRDRKQQ
ncbi:sterol desaturase family protein [Alloalcanivorax sp. C16-1]|uniref:sterol desaturase family protein n=1 Tax=Alloalcanivorax sp. C16-1 TaxID=3390051 RepID=UPI003970AE75